MTDMLKLLKTRRSIPAVNLVEPAPDEAEIKELLGIASRVPDHGKLAPWRFVVFAGPARKAAGEGLADLLKRRKPEATADELQVERMRFARAPLVIAVVSRAAPHVKIPEWEQQLSAGAAAMLLVVAANAKGYATQWVTEWPAYDEAASRFLGLKAGERIAGFIHIGTPNVPPAERDRPPLGDIIDYWQPA